MSKEGVLTGAVKSSIMIEQFVFHIIIKGEEQPRILNRVELEPSQYEFFSERIADASEGTQYKFQENDVGTALRAKRILDDPSKNFHAESIGLANDFHAQHSGNVNDGAFIISVFTASINGKSTSMLALLKMDHKRVLEYTITREGGERVAKMNEILNSFVEDKTAVQKCAIVELTDSYEWDVLAFERRKQTGIADYFRSFLRVIESDNASNLTRRAVVAVGTWARAKNETLPEVPRKYRIRATQYMEISDHFDTQEFIGMVISEDDEDKKQELTASLREYLQEEGVAGQKFTPKPKSIPDKEKKTKLQTAEGVQISWSGPDDAANIKILEKDPNGIYTISIRTPFYKEA